MIKLEVIYKWFFILFSIVFSLDGNAQDLSNSSGSNNDIHIELNENGLFINSMAVNRQSKFSEIDLNPDESYKAEKQLGNTFDSHYDTISISSRYYQPGLFLYYEKETGQLTSMKISFYSENLAEPQEQLYNVVLDINGVKIDYNSSLNDLINIPDLKIKSYGQQILAELFDLGLNFFFVNQSYKDGLSSVSIGFESEKHDKKEINWTEEEIESMKEG